MTQAAALPQLLEHLPLRRVLSSPALRCIQTVTPLASSRGLAVEPEAALGEESTVDAIELMERVVQEPVALCTHGDVVPVLLSWAADHGAVLPQQPLWEKASVWLLQTAGESVMSASHLEPPA